MSILAQIIETKREEVLCGKALRPLALKDCDKLPPTLGFCDRVISTKFPSIIAEIKRASPSKGIIRADLDPIETAKAYIEAGAAAISILTDELYFQGNLSDLKAVRKIAPTTPLLRKEFIIDAYQIYEARVAGADAVLLIVAALEHALLTELLAVAAQARLDVLLEVHTKEELNRAIHALRSATILPKTLIGINNRDLHTFETSLDTTREIAAHLRTLAPQTEFPLVAESGIFTAEDLKILQDYGADAFLIGESLIRQGAPGQNLTNLIAVARTTL